MELIYLLTGGNMGNRAQYLTFAREEIGKKIGVVIESSPIYETESWGKEDQGNYLNQVLAVKTLLDADLVLQYILAIEKEAGRERIEKWGDRVLDIDILFYGTQVINQPNLTIPHKHLHERNFALYPLLDVAPALIHPVLNQSIKELKENCSDNLKVSLYALSKDVKLS